MNQTGLSETYYSACERMHSYVAAFYDEFMHTEEGEPIVVLRILLKQY